MLLPQLPKQIARQLPRLPLYLALVDCAGGMPLLHPAQTLPAGEVRAVAGFSGNIAATGLAEAIRDASNEASANPNAAGMSGSDPTYARGALVAASVAPGLAPVGGARVGIGSQAEGGLVYSGRAVRADIRRSFEISPNWAVSVGAGGSSALYGRQSGAPLPNVDLSQLHGWGADLPILVGYESEGGLYMLWVGARGGWEHVDISQVRSEAKSVTLGIPPVSLSATRWWGGGLLGVATGFRHVHVSMEIDVSYQALSGDFAGTHAEVAGLNLTPGAALWWHF